MPQTSMPRAQFGSTGRGYFDKTKPGTSIQLINIIPVDGGYNPVRAVLGQLDFDALKRLLN